MEYIWQEMAEAMMRKDRSMFAHDCEPPDVAAAMADAWGSDRDAAVWTVEDVLDAAEDMSLSSLITITDARDVIKRLSEVLCGPAGRDELDKLIYTVAWSKMKDSNDDTDY